ncbi:MAG TPA: hypothetical protein VF834_19785 [Streptosporangiaceae bacterium]
MASRIGVPTLACPFGDSISPHASQVDEHVVEWARRCGLPRDDAEVARLTQAQVGRLAARTAPRASAVALEFLADWQMWLFLFDDQFCDESATGLDLARLSEVITAFVGVLDGASGDGRAEPFTAALAGLMRRLAGLATGQQVFRFVSAVRGYLLAQFWEAGHRAADRPAGLAEYQAMRRHSGAVPTCMALTDLADGYELAAREFCRADVRALADMAVNVTCWANDILSYPKESERSLRVHSLPAVIAAERHLPMAEALADAAALHDDEVTRYLEAEFPVRRSASPELICYLDGLRSWMGGNYLWSLETGRYNVAAGAAAPAARQTVALCESSSPERAASSGSG